MSEENKSQAAVYVGWTTFSNTLKKLAEGIPNVIDKSVFESQSGSVQGQLMAGLKFLGLIDDAGRPMPELAELATTDEAAQKAALKKILEKRYAHLFALDLTKATSAQLNETMATVYSVSGDTRERAVRFFLQAAQFAGVQLGRYLLQPNAANGGVPRKRRTGVPKLRGADEGTGDEGDEGNPPPPSSPPGTARTVELKSGGTLTVSASMDVFKLSPTDRTFVFALIDKLADYEGQSG